MEHTISGRLRRLDHMTKHRKMKIIHENMHLMVGMTFTANLHYPQLSPYTGTTDFISVSYVDRNKHNGCYGLRRLEEAKEPILIIVYGEEVEVQGLHTPLKFVPCFIQEKLRKL